MPYRSRRRRGYNRVAPWDHAITSRQQHTEHPEHSEHAHRQGGLFVFTRSKRKDARTAAANNSKNDTQKQKEHDTVRRRSSTLSIRGAFKGSKNAKVLHYMVDNSDTAQLAEICEIFDVSKSGASTYADFIQQDSEHAKKECKRIAKNMQPIIRSSLFFPLKFIKNFTFKTVGASFSSIKLALGASGDLLSRGWVYLIIVEPIKLLGSIVKLLLYYSYAVTLHPIYMQYKLTASDRQKIKRLRVVFQKILLSQQVKIQRDIKDKLFEKCKAETDIAKRCACNEAAYNACQKLITEPVVKQELEDRYNELKSYCP